MDGCVWCLVDVYGGEDGWRWVININHIIAARATLGPRRRGLGLAGWPGSRGATGSMMCGVEVRTKDHDKACRH